MRKRTRPTARVFQAMLAVEDGTELHGWDIHRQTGLLSQTIYKILERLADEGLMTFRWEELRPEDRRPRRRLYCLTEAGAEYARQYIERMPTA